MAPSARTVLAILLGSTLGAFGCASSPVQLRTNSSGDAQLERWLDDARELARQRRFAEALEAVDRAIVLAPEHFEAHRLRVHCLAGTQQFDELLLECDGTIALAAPDAWLLYERGVALEEIGRYPDAIASFARAIELDPAHFKAFQHRGWVRQLIGQHAEAIADFTEAIALTPDAGEHRLLLRRRAESLDALGRHDDAGSDRRAAESDAPR
jgi:tetratricopeptide (TPR) repeat protein